MKLKVCGMTDVEQLERLKDFKIDFAGMIFYEKSARFIGDKIKPPHSDFKNVAIDKVGVFVNADFNTIVKSVQDYDLAYVQLHGDETPEFSKAVQQIVPVIKAIRIGNDFDLETQLKRYEAAVSYFLFDTDSKQYGGTGQKFNWQLLQAAIINKPFFLSGGIGLEDIDAVKSFQHPNLFAIDVNSKLEISPGIKDMKKVKSFSQGFKQLV